MTPESTPQWYALHVKSRSEKLASTLLRNKGYEEFAPMYRGRRRWSDRIKYVELPLFPGYVFCRFDVNHRLPVLVTPGVVQIVGFGNLPSPVDPVEISALQTVVRSGLTTEPWPYLRVGSKVCIDYGPLKGIEGILIDVKSRQRLVLSVSLLQRSVSVEIDRDRVSPLQPFRTVLASY
jgi:transcription antitermination factor NusG